MRRKRLDAYLSVRLSNIRYLTGFTGSDATLLVTSRGDFLITDGRYDVQAREEVRGADVVISDRKWEDVSRRLRSARSARVGYEAAHLTMQAFRRFSRGRAERWV